MAHLIYFTTGKFDVSKEAPNPINPIAGQSALDWLRGELANSRYECTEPDAEDWGWYIDVRDADTVYMVGASAEPDDAGADVEWALQVHKSRTLKDKLLGRNKMASDDPLSVLIENLVRADAAIHEITVDRDA